MSFLSKLLSRTPLDKVLRGGEEECLKLLEQGISLLRLSSFNSLQKRYCSQYSPENANILAVAVVSVMILESPKQDSFAGFYERNRKEIGELAMEVRTFEELCGPSGCASYLYAAEMLHSSMVKAAYIPDATKNWKSAKALEEQAANLGIPIPTLHDICGSDDKKKAVEAIYRFAKLFYYTNTWIGRSPAITDVSLPTLPYSYEFLASMLLDVSSASPETPVQPQATHDGEEMPSMCRLRLNN